VWSLVAPDPNSPQRPSFDASDPSAYPAGAWRRYDLIDQLASSLGMNVSLMLVGPAPRWAWAAHDGNVGPELGRYPNPADVEQFMQAAGTRYDGSFDPGGQSGGSAGSGGGLGGLGRVLGLGGSSQTQPPPLPAIRDWEIWNEPNGGSWLDPYYRRSGRREIYLQGAEYRSIANASWRGLQASGHGQDTILVGETANVGIAYPIPFLRALYCVGSNDRPLHGSAAAGVDCPTGGSAQSFVNSNPGLFQITGWAHHPYGFDTPPDRHYHNAQFVTIQNLSWMERILDGIFSAYGSSRAGGVPLYLTEWGYETNPPNPYHHTSLAEQAQWLNEGEFETWQEPYVRAVTQFELVDNGPDTAWPKTSIHYWSTFQTGLEFVNGRRKPGYWSFMLPIWVPRAHTGRAVTVWGQLRPADHATLQYGELQFRARGASGWSNLEEIDTDSPEGFFVARPRIRRPGYLRLTWLDPSDGVTYYGRTVTIG
jgi:hypothetical protein